jgi:Leucine-rich repeat (LRR) protein
LPRLTFIDARDNRLTILPSELGTLVALERLFVSNNALSGIPEELGNCTNLTEIVAGHNTLTSVPSSLGKLENLNQLVLKDNLLQQLPPTFLNLKLGHLDIRENRLCNISSDMRLWIDAVSSDSDWESRQDCR